MNSSDSNTTKSSLPTEEEAIAALEAEEVYEDAASSTHMRIVSILNWAEQRSSWWVPILLLVALSTTAISIPYMTEIVGGLLASAAGFLTATRLINYGIRMNSSELTQNQIIEAAENPDIKLQTGVSAVDKIFNSTLDVVHSMEEKLGALPQRYRELSERYELVTTNIAASVIIREIDSTISLFSPYTQVLTGYTEEELSELNTEPGELIAAIVLEEDAERYQRARQVSLLGEDILVRYRIRHRSGLVLWLETRVIPVCDKSGEVESLMSVTIDVTETLTYQEQIEEQNRDLGDFAYMVSHDLKAPIFTIKGMANALKEDYSEQLGDDQQLVDYIIDGANRLERLVASVIEYSSISTKPIDETEVDLNTSVREVKADLGELIRSLDADITVRASLPCVLGDPIRIYQVFSNLIGNALKYSHPDRKPKIEISARRINTTTVAIDVTDNGQGVPENKLEEIFRPYRRAHGADVEGSGIGLACVKKIVERLGGTVTLASVYEKGSTFTVTFPATKQSPREIPDDLARLF
jgi:PAS domain S-box-containing protein